MKSPIAMKKKYVLAFVPVMLFILAASFSYAQSGREASFYYPRAHTSDAGIRGERLALSVQEEEPEEFDEDFASDEIQNEIPDPLEKVNRVFFTFNDRLYFWFLKPVATDYGKVVPEKIRLGIRNFFSNILFPVRFVNCLLQAKGRNAGDELGRFVVNSTIGMGGFFDVATRWNIEKHKEDLGQTLAVYGMGPAFYIVWPVLGPSSLRGTIGYAGDVFLNPLNYLIDETEYDIALWGIRTINNVSFTIGDYEALKKAALDPYVALREIYYQYRLNQIKE